MPPRSWDLSPGSFSSEPAIPRRPGGICVTLQIVQVLLTLTLCRGTVPQRCQWTVEPLCQDDGWPDGMVLWASGPRESCDSGRTSVRAQTLVCAPMHAFPLYSCIMTSREHGWRGERTYAERATRPSRQCRGPSESRAPPPARGGRPPRPDRPEHPTLAAEQARRGPAPPPAASGIAPASRPTAGDPVRGVVGEQWRCVSGHLSRRHPLGARAKTARTSAASQPRFRRYTLRAIERPHHPREGGKGRLHGLYSSDVQAFLLR